jgi:outer membrane protein OmpA-like peptidoglycan-associated protein
MKKIYTISLALIAIVSSSCSNPQPGPDKTAAGAALGAAWGAGAGAVVGHQVGRAGEGVAIGAGLGIVQGALTGAGYDMAEEDLIDQRRELSTLKIANQANRQRLTQIKAGLDVPNSSSVLSAGVYQVFFDVDQTNLRSGAIANLETIADNLMKNPNSFTVNVAGHSDDSGTPEYNQRLSEARARSVTSYLAARGISMDQIQVSSHGSSQPIASNASPEGRQLNRRVDVSISSRRIS